MITRAVFNTTENKITLKKITFLLLLSLAFAACKKDNNSSKEFKRLRSMHTSGIDWFYFYNSDGKLERLEISYRQPVHGTPKKQTQTFTYDVAGRMVQAKTYAYTDTYSYNAGGQISQHTRVDTAGKRDSVTFTFRGDSCFGSWGKKARYAFYNNCLREVVYYSNYSTNGTPKSEAAPTRYTYNSTLDRTFAKLLESYEPRTLADFNISGFYPSLFELTSYTATSISFGRPQTKFYGFIRTYDNDQYPIARTTYGSSEGIVFFTYY